MPRSGSMWTYNVCRRLITAADKKPWPDEVPLDESPAIQHALSQPPAPDQIYCIKTHFQIPVGKPHMRIICNYRDIRDATLSYMRFMKCSFEQALAVAQGSMELTNHYLQPQDSNVLPLRYDTIINQPQQTISSLARFLSLPTEPVEIEKNPARLIWTAVSGSMTATQDSRPTISVQTWMVNGARHSVPRNRKS